MRWDTRIPHWIVTFLLAAWTLLGVNGYIQDRVKEVTLDTTACEVLKVPWAGCVSYDSVVHVRAWWPWSYWIVGMVHEAAHVEQWRTGWDNSSPDTEKNADGRAWRALIDGILRR